MNRIGQFFMDLPGKARRAFMRMVRTPVGAASALLTAACVLAGLAWAFWPPAPQPLRAIGGTPTVARVSTPQPLGGAPSLLGVGVRVEPPRPSAPPAGGSTGSGQPLVVSVTPGEWQETGLILKPGLDYVVRVPHWSGGSKPELYAGCRYGTEIRGGLEPLPAGQILGDTAVGYVLATARFPGELMFWVDGGRVTVEVEPGVPSHTLEHTISRTRSLTEIRAEL